MITFPYVCRLWMARYRVALSTRALRSEQAYQNAVDRLADIKREENVHLLKGATVQWSCSIEQHAYILSHHNFTLCTANYSI